ncbi:hypothetical protein [Halomonas chromatireducens]|uniref:Core-binding (CB) domain-containing protein n=1 Tax=Halomonas chromatireducens TaxID=507626 RepID=A0A0X8HE65_9GAMM|nr:hypothetical protein LOKO_01908 [Halomonas chromatireducens]
MSEAGQEQTPQPQLTVGQDASVVPVADRAAARIAAGDDHHAVALWLAEFRASPQTLRAYRREAERLLLWLGEQGSRRIPPATRS